MPTEKSCDRIQSNQGLFLTSCGMRANSPNHWTTSKFPRPLSAITRCQRFFFFLNFWRAHFNSWEKETQSSFFDLLSGALGFSSLKCGCCSTVPLRSHLAPLTRLGSFRETWWYGNKSPKEKTKYSNVTWFQPVIDAPSLSFIPFLYMYSW